VIGVDYGTRRVGLAISDPLGITARPLEVVPRPDLAVRMRELITEYDIETVVVGVPRSLGGGESASTVGARLLGEQLGADTGLEVVYVDERFTSKMAEEALVESGMKRRKRRETVDKVAAAIILQTYLDGNPRPSGDVESPGAQ
jgi:putative holliday junction resolvase